MAYQFENVKLEKGMYGHSGRSFTKVLETLDPSENYKGTAYENLDAFQRQLKRFDIHVKGAGSDMVEKFFHTSDSAVLFPEFVSRVVRQGMEEGSILPHRVRSHRGGKGAQTRGGGREHPDHLHPDAGKPGQTPQARAYAGRLLRGHPLSAA